VSENPVDDDDIVLIAMTPGHVRSYMRWLDEHELHLFEIPLKSDLGRVFGVGVNDELMQR
jgi:hypothetical protein